MTWDVESCTEVQVKPHGRVETEVIKYKENRRNRRFNDVQKINMKCFILFTEKTF